MKYLTLFIIALWMISMFVLAAEEQEGEKSQEVTDQEKVADTEDDSHDIDENQWGRRCFWTHCSRHNSWCPRGTYAIQERRCGRWGTSYCCARRHWGGGGGHHDHDHDEESNTEEQT
ncbi:hypothetical protein BJ944DRAFT_243723 [Cunninghamella echinulata]|nr:hypothetical protein BJ944DRAFT_243723 [Cunninghamella echinulata]